MNKKIIFSLFVTTLFAFALILSCNTNNSNGGQQTPSEAQADAAQEDENAIVKHINSFESFETTISNKEKVVLVDFWASWCGPCKMVAPIVEAIAEENTGKLVVAKVDMDQQFVKEIGLAELYEISAIPCFILFSEGKEVARNVGYMEKEQFDAWLNNYLK